MLGLPMPILGIELTYWISSAALVIALASASFSFAQWRINARKERREISANDPIVHAELPERARIGNGWLLAKLSIQRVEDVRFATIDVVATGATMLKVSRKHLGELIIPVSDADGAARLSIEPHHGSVGIRGLSPPPLRTDHWFWLSAPSRPGTIRLCIDLRSSNLPIRHWQKTVMLKLTSEMISAANAKVSAADDDVSHFM